MADCETLEDVPEEPVRHAPMPGGENDFPSMGVDLVKRVNFKVAFFLLLMGMFLFSDLFVENILSSKHRLADTPNTLGTTIQLVVFVLAYIVIDLLVQGGIL